MPDWIEAGGWPSGVRAIKPVVRRRRMMSIGMPRVVYVEGSSVSILIEVAVGQESGHVEE